MTVSTAPRRVVSRAFEDVSPRAERELVGLRRGTIEARTSCLRIAYYNGGDGEVDPALSLSLSPILVPVYKPLLATFISTIEALGLVARYPFFPPDFRLIVPRARSMLIRGTPRAAERKCRCGL